MADTRFSKVRKDAHHLSMQARALLHVLGDHVRGLPPYLIALLRSIADLPAMRRSRFRRTSIWLWRRFLHVLSDGYNFEEFYRTQYGLGAKLENLSSDDLPRLPGATLLEKAYDLGDEVIGVSAMRVLVERAVVKAEQRLSATKSARSYKLKPYDPSIHHQWRDAIEEAFAPHKRRVSAPASMREEGRDKMSSVIEQPEWGRPLPQMVVDDETFELNVPEVVPYRASTRH